MSLTAQPGYKFRRWDGDLSGTIPAGVVTMSAPRVVTALLDPVPYLAPAGVGNAAGTTPIPGVAPGGIVSIFGVNLAAVTLVAPDGMLPQTLGGLTVRVADRILPLFFVSSLQINAQLPDDLALGSQILTVSPAGAADVRASFTVVRNAPGLFPVAVNGQAMAGELLTVYGTGFGPAAQARPEGFPIPPSPAYSIVDAVTVQVGQAAIAAEQAFAVPGRCGIDAVQFRLDGSITGTVTLRVTINGADAGGTSWKELIQPLDRGTYDVSQVLRLLRKMKYTGPIGLQHYGIGGDARENLEHSMEGWKRLSGAK